MNWQQTRLPSTCSTGQPFLLPHRAVRANPPLRKCYRTVPPPQDEGSEPENHVRQKSGESPTSDSTRCCRICNARIGHTLIIYKAILSGAHRNVDGLQQYQPQSAPRNTEISGLLYLTVEVYSPSRVCNTARIKLSCVHRKPSCIVACIGCRFEHTHIYLSCTFL